MPKSDPDGGRMPSGLSGAGAAWRMIAVMARNLDAAMRKPAPGPGRAPRRMKALRFPLIALPAAWRAMPGIGSSGFRPRRMPWP